MASPTLAFFMQSSLLEACKKKKGFKMTPIEKYLIYSGLVSFIGFSLTYTHKKQKQRFYARLSWVIAGIFHWGILHFIGIW